MLLGADLALQLQRATEAAARAAAWMVGTGEPHQADHAAIREMRAALVKVPVTGRVVVGEGLGESGFASGSVVGDGGSSDVDIAVDALHGARLAADGRPNALSVICVSGPRTMFDPGPVSNMVILVGPGEFADLLDLDRPLDQTLALVAERKDTDVRELTVAVCDLPRHEVAVQTIRRAGARVRLLDSQLAGAVLAAGPERSVDLHWGEGSASAGVLAAGAAKCLGAVVLARLRPHGAERERAEAAGCDMAKVLTQDDLVAADCVVCATGVTDGDLLAGVRYDGAGVMTTESLVMHSTSRGACGVARRRNTAERCVVRWSPRPSVETPLLV